MYKVPQGGNKLFPVTCKYSNTHEIEIRLDSKATAANNSKILTAIMIIIVIEQVPTNDA